MWPASVKKRASRFFCIVVSLCRRTRQRRVRSARRAGSSSASEPCLVCFFVVCCSSIGFCLFSPGMCERRISCFRFDGVVVQCFSLLHLGFSSCPAIYFLCFCSCCSCRAFRGVVFCFAGTTPSNHGARSRLVSFEEFCRFFFARINVRSFLLLDRSPPLSIAALREHRCRGVLKTWPVAVTRRGNKRPSADFFAVYVCPSFFSVDVCFRLALEFANLDLYFCV